ncbi:hypothetical protein D3C87_1570720 [compost metagenome]
MLAGGWRKILDGDGGLSLAAELDVEAPLCLLQAVQGAFDLAQGAALLDLGAEHLELRNLARLVAGLDGLAHGHSRIGIGASDLNARTLVKDLGVSIPNLSRKVPAQHLSLILGQARVQRRCFLSRLSLPAEHEWLADACHVLAAPRGGERDGVCLEREVRVGQRCGLRFSGPGGLDLSLRCL